MKLMAALVFSTATASGAIAAILQPVAYDLNNGHGQASGGSFNYWDRFYSGAGCTNCDNAALTGGTGDLTDGVVTPSNWFQIENNAGSGPYVGWRQGVLPDLSVLFRFGGSVSIDTITIHADDSGGAGGVNLPASVRFDWNSGSQSFAVVDPDVGTGPSFLGFSGLGITAATFVRVAFEYANEWVFVDEVRFEGSRDVPEPQSGALVALALAGIAVLRRRRKGPGFS